MGCEAKPFAHVTRLSKRKPAFVKSRMKYNHKPRVTKRRVSALIPWRILKKDCFAFDPPCD